MENILEKILYEKKRRLMGEKQLNLQEKLEIISNKKRITNTFARIMKKNREPLIIAEIKYASPSRGKILGERDPVLLLDSYSQGGASAISVVTEEQYFNGNVHLLSQVVGNTSLPVLRKDFVLEDIQIYESACFGASALLLIARIISKKRLKNFILLCELLNIVPLVEVHEENDLEKALNAGAKYIGINNRDLTTFQVSIENTLRLLKYVPNEVTVVSESGIKNRRDIEYLMAHGVEHFLIGESLLLDPNPARKIKELRGEVEVGMY
ncbi:MAG: indole-3-glycerol phosphate synthase TrpC [Atribacterota bacterium]